MHHRNGARRREVWHVLIWIAGCAAAFGCSRNPPPAVLPLAGPINFTAQTSRDTMVEGTFEGTAVIHDGWIDVALTKMTLTFPPGPTERWRSLTVRAFLAADYHTGIWKAPVESRPTNVWRFLSFPTRRSSTERTSIVITEAERFVVPIPPGASLATSRLAIELEWVALYRDYGQTESNYAISSAPLVSRPPMP